MSICTEIEYNQLAKMMRLEDDLTTKPAYNDESTYYCNKGINDCNAAMKCSFSAPLAYAPMDPTTDEPIDWDDYSIEDEPICKTGGELFNDSDFEGDSFDPDDFFVDDDTLYYIKPAEKRYQFVPDYIPKPFPVSDIRSFVRVEKYIPFDHANVIEILDD